MGCCSSPSSIVFGLHVYLPAYVSCVCMYVGSGPPPASVANQLSPAQRPASSIEHTVSSSISGISSSTKHTTHAAQPNPNPTHHPQHGSEQRSCSNASRVPGATVRADYRSNPNAKTNHQHPSTLGPVRTYRYRYRYRPNPSPIPHPPSTIHPGVGHVWLGLAR